MPPQIDRVRVQAKVSVETGECLERRWVSNCMFQPRTLERPSCSVATRGPAAFLSPSFRFYSVLGTYFVSIISNIRRNSIVQHPVYDEDGSPLACDSAVLARLKFRFLFIYVTSYTVRVSGTQPPNMPGILPMKVIKVGTNAQTRIAQACDR